MTNAYRTQPVVLPRPLKSAEFELLYRHGSFAMREYFTEFRSAIARVRALDSTSSAHSFAIMKEDQMVLSGEEILDRISHPVPGEGAVDPLSQS